MNTDTQALLISDIKEALSQGLWDDPSPRLVYADWLEEGGDIEEATRQRKWVPCMQRLVEIAESEDEFNTHIRYKEESWHDKAPDGRWAVDDYEYGAGLLLYWLDQIRAELNGDSGYMRTDTPHVDWSPEQWTEVWACYEVIRNVKAPEGKWPTTRLEIPYISCSC